MMNDTLLNRIRRLVSGGANSIVDAVENATPEMVMSEAVREIESATEQARDELGKVVAGRHVANKRLMEANRRHEELGEQVALAVTQGRDDLAEAAISRQLDLEAQMPVLEAAINDASAEQQEIEGYVAALTARRREMEEELDQFRAARQHQTGGPQSSDPAGNLGAAQGAAERADGAFNRAMKSATGLGVPGGVDTASATQLAELEKLSRENRIAERLSALKTARAREGQ